LRTEILSRKHTFAEPELLRLLDDGTTGGTADVSVQLTLDDLEEQIGFVCFEANHTEDRNLQRRLDEVSNYLQSIVDSYMIPQSFSNSAWRSQSSWS